MPYQVTMCVCMKMSFAEWLRRKEENNWTLQAAALNTGCGESCGSCRPYLKIAARTGMTELPILNRRDLQAALKDA